jgi:hypothetical protein
MVGVVDGMAPAEFRGSPDTVTGGVAWRAWGPLPVLPVTATFGVVARACDSLSATTMANSPNVTIGSKAALIGLQDRSCTRYSQYRSGRTPAEGRMDANSERARLALGFEPIWARPDVNNERHPEGRDIFHLVANKVGQGLDLPWGRLENQLIVHLEEHLAL